MLPPVTRTHGSGSPRGRSALSVAIIVFAVVTGILAVPRAWAIGGRIDVHTTHQESRSGDQEVRGDDLWELFGLDELVRLSRRSALQLQYLARRDVLSGTAAGVTVDNTTVLQNPSASLSWQSAQLRASLYGSGQRLDLDNAGAPAQRDDNFEVGLWTMLRRGRVGLDVNYHESSSWRRGEGLDNENHEKLGSADLKLNLSRHDDVQARYSRVDLDAVSLGHRTTFETARLQYSGDRSFAAERGRLGWSLMQSRFDQRDRYDRTLDRRYILPLTGGYWIDDTPAELDPLENQPEAVPALFDNDRDTPTTVNLGDNAPPGRNQGGDYRNLYLDFGEPREMSAAFLYVDRRLTFIPEVMQWDLYFCDEAEGRDWGQPVSPTAWSVRYVEPETGRQGWELTFTTPVSHRRLKLVNRKLGPTTGDLFVTEFEVLQDVSDQPADSGQKQDRTLVEGNFEYRFHPRLQVRFDSTFDRRSHQGAAGDQRRLNHAAYAGWKLEGWLVNAQAMLTSEESPSRLKTDSNSQLVSLMRQAPGRLSARLSWSRTEDDNYNAHYLTRSLTGDATWRAAPLLAITQRVTRGWRDGQTGASDSDSWVANTELRSAPRPGMRLDVSRVLRWVSREAGAGFTSYGETQVDASWEIRPLLVWSGQYVSQKRDERDWILRNSVSWTPLPGGSVLLNLQASDYQDSRIDQLRRGGGASVDWQARRQLLLSAGFEKSYERLEGRQSWPLSFQARGYWTF
jgi:hypothetical protein